jgi:hypothetical protein
MSRVAGFVVILWTLAAILAGTGHAANYPELNALASYWAQRPITIECPEDWATDPWATGTWGYTFLGADEATVDPSLCEAALELADSAGAQRKNEDWRAALSVLVITHEALHLRYWKWNANEARVECRAIRSWPESFLMLSNWNLPAFRQAMPYALAEHYQLAAMVPEYNFKKCKIGWWPPW